MSSTQAGSKQYFASHLPGPDFRAAAQSPNMSTAHSLLRCPLVAAVPLFYLIAKPDGQTMWHAVIASSVGGPAQFLEKACVKAPPNGMQDRAWPVALLHQPRLQ